MPAGTVEVFLIGATGIKNKEVTRFLTGRADPYAVLTCGRQRLRSNTATGQGSKPSWNQKFSFYIDDNVSDLQIKLYDRNVLLEDVEIGTTKIPLAKVFVEAKLPTTTYNVVPPSGGVQGEVKLSITFTAKRKPGQTDSSDISGPYSAKVQSSSDISGPYGAKVQGPYKANAPPEPPPRTDPLHGPHGYFKSNSYSSNSSASDSGSSHGHGHGHGHSLLHPYLKSDSDMGSVRPYPPAGMHSSGPSGFHDTSSQYHRNNSGSSSYPPGESLSPTASLGTSHARPYPGETQSSDHDYTGSAYTDSPYGSDHPARVGPSPLAPHGYPTSASHGSPSFNIQSPRPGSGGNPYSKLDDVAGRLEALSVSGDDSQGYPRYPSFSNDSRPPTSYPPTGPVDHHYHNPGLPPSVPPGGYPPPPSYPPPPPQSYPPPPPGMGPGGFPGPYGMQAPPSSFYPPELGAHHQPYGNSDSFDLSSAYPPSQYYGAPPSHYIPAGYPK